MKNSQHDDVNKFDDIEDLTLFADESFDTAEVDLFEFSSDNDSPLNRLKSIILSLDWEISDEILQELSDEVQELKASWDGDKIATVYLQGLMKLGSYLRVKGAYAHPNAIKLLLTFYYDFEKIVSTTDITSDAITNLLKGDVRKFKILQYQIDQTLDRPELKSALLASKKTSSETKVETSAPDVAQDPLKLLKSAMFSLDWEVTDHNLNQFNDFLAFFHKNYAERKPELVLVQGLQALVDYIAEEKSYAHPDSFSLLHLFFDALETVHKTIDEEVDPKALQDLLVDRVTRLNTLKSLIAEKQDGPRPEPKVEKFVDQLTEPDFQELTESIPKEKQPSAPAQATEGVIEDFDSIAGVDSNGTPELPTGIEEQLDSFFPTESTSAMETADTQYPDEVLPPDAIHPVDDDIADSFIEEQFSSREGMAPALAGSGDSTGFTEEGESLDVPAQTDLETQLDFLFSEDDESTDTATEVTHDEQPDLVSPLSVESESGVIAALADAERPADISDADQDSLYAEETGDIGNKLDHFFGSDTAIPEIEATGPSPEEAPGVAPALADSEEAQGFSEDATIAAMDESPIGDIEEKLDFFFGEEDVQTAEESDLATPAEDNLEQSLDTFFDEEPPPTDTVDQLTKAVEEEIDSDVPPGPAPALAESDEESDYAASIPLEEVSEGSLDRIEEKLDSFFSEEQVEAPSQDLTDTRKEVEPLDEFEAPGTLFGEEELEQNLDFILDETQDDIEVISSPEQPIAGEPEVIAPMGTASSPETQEERQVYLAALGALIPGIVKVPTKEGVEEADKLIAEIGKTPQTPDQRVLLQLLSSVLSHLPNRVEVNKEETTDLLNRLFNNLTNEQFSPDTLPDTVTHYTEWLNKMMEKVTAATLTSSQLPKSIESDEAFRLAVRSVLKEEFASLQDEIKGGN